MAQTRRRGSLTKGWTDQKRRGFRPTLVGKIMPTDPFAPLPRLLKLTRMWRLPDRYRRNRFQKSSG